MYVRTIKPSATRAAGWRWRLAQAIEIRWWRRYLGARDVATYLTWKRGYWREFLRRADLPSELTTPSSGLGERPRVLDAGCGPAGIFLVLDPCDVDAVDPLLERYRELPHFRPDEVPWVRWHGEPLESFSETAAYDYIFCLNVINHVRDVGRVLEVLAKALAPGGRLVLSVDAHRHGWLKRIFAAVPGDILHPHQFDLAEYEALCEASGLVVRTRLCYQQEAIFSYWVLTCERAL